MANPYFLGCDLSIPTYTWSAGVNASYPVSNLATYFVADVSKSNATTDAQYITIDLGVATSCNTIAISGQNFTSTGIGEGQVELQTNTNDDATWTDATIVTLLDYASDDHSVVTFDATTKRYWRILFSKGSALSAAPQFGNIFLGTRTTFESTYEWDFAKSNKEYQTSETQSLNGDIRTSQSFAGRKRWDLLFRLQSNTFKTAWDTFLGIVRGRLRPFYFVDADGTTINYVHLDTDFVEIKQIRYNQNNLRIPLKTQTVS